MSKVLKKLFILSLSVMILSCNLVIANAASCNHNHMRSYSKWVDGGVEDCNNVLDEPHYTADGFVVCKVHVKTRWYFLECKDCGRLIKHKEKETKRDHRWELTEHKDMD